MPVRPGGALMACAVLTTFLASTAEYYHALSSQTGFEQACSSRRAASHLERRFIFFRLFFCRAISGRQWDARARLVWLNVPACDPGTHLRPETRRGLLFSRLESHSHCRKKSGKWQGLMPTYKNPRWRTEDQSKHRSLGAILEVPSRKVATQLAPESASRPPLSRRDFFSSSSKEQRRENRRRVHEKKTCSLKKKFNFLFHEVGAGGRESWTSVVACNPGSTHSGHRKNSALALRFWNVGGGTARMAPRAFARPPRLANGRKFGPPRQADLLNGVPKNIGYFSLLPTGADPSRLLLRFFVSWVPQKPPMIVTAIGLWNGAAPPSHRRPSEGSSPRYVPNHEFVGRSPPEKQVGRARRRNCPSSNCEFSPTTNNPPNLGRLSWKSFGGRGRSSLRRFTTTPRRCRMKKNQSWQQLASCSPVFLCKPQDTNALMSTYSLQNHTFGRRAPIRAQRRILPREFLNVRQRNFGDGAQSRFPRPFCERTHSLLHGRTPEYHGRAAKLWPWRKIIPLCKAGWSAKPLRPIERVENTLDMKPQPNSPKFFKFNINLTNQPRSLLQTNWLARTSAIYLLSNLSVVRTIFISPLQTPKRPRCYGPWSMTTPDQTDEHGVNVEAPLPPPKKKPGRGWLNLSD